MTTVKRKYNQKDTREKQSLVELAHERIKQRIITMAFEPGSYLNEAAVSEEIGIGRTPVHHAVRRLTLEGMLEVIPRKGLLVKPVSLNEVMEIIEVRLINECHCARLAAQRASDKDLEAIRAIVEEACTCAEDRDTERQMLLDRDFHCAISAAARNRVLSDLLRNLHERSLRFWFISLNDEAHSKAVCREHSAIVEAIERHDPDAAEAAMRAHIEAFRENVRHHI